MERIGDGAYAYGFACADLLVQDIVLADERAD